MSSEVFQKISEDNIPKMLKALQQDWPKHYNLFQMFTTMREYKKAGSPWHHSVYLHGDFDTGVYLHRLTSELPNRVVDTFYIYTPTIPVTLVKECLEKTEVLPWKNSFMFHMIDSRFRSAVEDVCSSKNATCQVFPNTMFWYPPKNELILKDIPEDLCLEFLDESYAEEMNRNWPHKSPGSEIWLAEHIRWNFGLGLFRKSDRKLLSSALSMFTGGIFVLYTDPEHRGKGYAGLIVEHMTREIRKRNRIPFATILIGNKSSEATFTKAGFEPLKKVDYISIDPIS